MHNVTFDMSTMHLHGAAFYDFLRLRKSFFVDTLDWDIPHNSDVEMDQYDNPAAWYSVVIRHGQVVGGARTMPADARWGDHTCMLHDAVRGRLPGIPAEVVSQEIAVPGVWECTRLVIANSVQSHRERSRALALIVDGLVDVAQARGATEMVAISVLPLVRALRRLGHQAYRIGDPYTGGEDGRTYAVMKMPATRSDAMLAEFDTGLSVAS